MSMNAYYNASRAEILKRLNPKLKNEYLEYLMNIPEENE